VGALEWVVDKNKTKKNRKKNEQALVLAKQFTAASSIETFLSSRYY